MSELAVTLLRFSYLGALWVFILIAISVLRKDIYGTRITLRGRRGSRRANKALLAGGAWPASASGYAAAPSPAPGIAPAPSHTPGNVPTRLVVTNGPLRGTTLPLGDGPVLIGRSASANLVLDDDYASGRHAQLVRRGHEWLIEDFGSTNGSFVDGERVHQSMPVHVGSIVRVGQTTMELHE